MGMYRTSRSTRNHNPHAAVVSVDHIIQPCQLIPRFPTPIPRVWFSGRVMDLATDFYLNRYLNHYLFEDLHPSHRNIT